jgi:hypothetical protein
VVRFAAALDVVAVARLVVAVRVGRTMVVPEDMLDDVVLVLVCRSCCRVVGRAGDLVPIGLADLVVVFRVCVVIFVFLPTAGEVFLVSGRVVRARASSIIAFSGLDGFKGETGRDRYDALVGDVISGDCLYVRELEDFGERTFDSASRRTCDTERGWPAALGLPRFFGLSRARWASGRGAFSLSE